MPKVREPIVSGIFYPDSPEKLKEELMLRRRQHTETAAPAASAASPVRAVVTPHAAYEYSGAVTTAAYEALRGSRAERILLIGPVHREKENKLFLPEAEVFRTPLGDTPVDCECVEKLAAACSCAVIDDIPHTEEHCLETQLPFIHYYFPGSSIIPVLTGDLTKRNAGGFIEALFSSIPRMLQTTIIIVTVNTASAPAYEAAKQQAGELEKEFSPGNDSFFFTIKAKKQLSVCSPQCIGMLLHNKFAFTNVNMLNQRSSADFTGTDAKTVFYSAYTLS